MDLLLLAVLAALTLLSITLLRAYRLVPVKELKRRARAGDKQAGAMFKAAAYGNSLHILLWFLVGLTAGVFFWFVSNNMPSAVAILLSLLLLWYGFAWMPGREAGGFGKGMAASAAPALAWILQYAHAIIDIVASFVQKRWPITVHTGLYDQDDLLELLHYQMNQPDNAIPHIELDIAAHALTFGRRQVRDALVPRRMVKMVKADEAVGPILMNELHQSGFSRFPVYEGKKDKIVGTLFMRDLIRGKKGGIVAKVMHPEVYYVHEDQPITDALQAILKTHHHLLIVVNSFEEYVGVITIEDVLEQVVGSPIIDEFDQYDDLRAVAKRVAAEDHKTNEEPVPAAEPKPEASPEPVKVVE